MELTHTLYTMNRPHLTATATVNEDWLDRTYFITDWSYLTQSTVASITAPTTACTCSTMLPPWVQGAVNLQGRLPISKNHFTVVAMLSRPGASSVCLEAIVNIGRAKSMIDKDISVASQLKIVYSSADFEVGGFISPAGKHTPYIGELKEPLQW